MNYLVDTNQAGRKKCEAYLQGEKGAAWISDSSLHSIGVLMFRQKPQLSILSLSNAGYLQLGEVHTRHGLDFDDACQ